MDLKDSIGSLFDSLIVGFGILFILGSSSFGYQLQTFNSFRQDVNYKIERRGGLTQEAMDEIQSVSLTKFGGWYSVESKQIGEKVLYGETVDYTIKAEYPMFFISNRASIKLQSNGQGLSQVR